MGSTKKHINYLFYDRNIYGKELNFINELSPITVAWDKVKTVANYIQKHFQS